MCSTRINEIDKILQQKGQVKKNSNLQRILSNLSDELEVFNIYRKVSIIESTQLSDLKVIIVRI